MLSGLLTTSWRSREPFDLLPDEAIEFVLGNSEEPPENILSRPSIDGEIVEKVVPLGACEDIMEAFVRWYWYGFEDRELTDSVLLLEETGLDSSDRSRRASSIVFISFAVLWIVERSTGPPT